MDDLEIEQETERQLRELDIRQQLRAVDRQDFVDSLDLGNDGIFNDEVDPKCR
jgi:hypothetical protein